MSNARKDWLDVASEGLCERDRRLLDRASCLLESNIRIEHEGKPVPWAPLRGIIPSPYRYVGIWNWDSAFHAVAVARWDLELAHEQVRIILDRQQPSGLLPDVIWPDGTMVASFGKPPVYPWACVRVDELHPDDEFLSYCYERFKPYEAFWRRERGGDDEGLFHYTSAATDPAVHYDEARYETGWDDSVRWDKGVDEFWAIDLNCYMVTLYRAMARMAERLGLQDELRPWLERAKTLAGLVNERMWDEENGAYCDVSRADGRSTGVLSPASFTPLFAGIAPKDRAERLAKLASDPRKFYPGMPTVSYDNPEYNPEQFWRGPTWLNTAWFACRGLKDYGFGSPADEIRDTILNWVDVNTESIYEYYHSKTGKPVGAAQFAWSAAFVIEFILDW